MSTRKIIRSQRVCTAQGVRPAAIHMDGRTITDVSRPTEVPEGAQLVDVGDSVIMAGLVDTHVHVNEPGRTEWEGFESATRAAAAGGITTLVDMPLNSIPPTTTTDGLRRKRDSAHEHCFIDVGFWGGVVPGNMDQIEPLIRAGALGFKCFLIHSGVDEFPHVTEDALRPAMEIIAGASVPLLVHAELPAPIEAGERATVNMDPRRYETFLRSRPRAAENDAVAMMIRLCRDTGAPVHIVHHSSSDALDTLERARNDGLPITVETCPHYLHLTAEGISNGATQFKCCPPIRERDNRELLWAALRAGVIDTVVSDHSPCAPGLKRLDVGDFMQAWGGVASLQLGLPIIWTEARERGCTIEQLAEWMCVGPARMAGLGDKGRLEPGRVADLVVWDPDASFQVDGQALLHRHATTPYDGETLYGRVELTILGGETIYDRGELADQPSGRLLSCA